MLPQTTIWASNCGFMIILSVSCLDLALPCFCFSVVSIIVSSLSTTPFQIFWPCNHLWFLLFAPLGFWPSVLLYSLLCNFLGWSFSHCFWFKFQLVYCQFHFQSELFGHGWCKAFTWLSALIYSIKMHELQYATSCGKRSCTCAYSLVKLILQFDCACITV